MLLIIPASALPVSGSEGIISAHTREHPLKSMLFENWLHLSIEQALCIRFAQSLIAGAKVRIIFVSCKSYKKKLKISFVISSFIRNFVPQWTLTQNNKPNKRGG